MGAAAIRSSGLMKRVEAIGIPLPGAVDDLTVGFLAVGLPLPAGDLGRKPEPVMR